MFFFFKHKTAYDVLISDWSSDVCSSDLWLYPSYGGWVRVGGGVCVAMWKRIAVYGLLLGLGTLALQWLDYQRMARLHMRGVYDLLLAAGLDRKSVVEGKGVSVRVDPGGCRYITQKIKHN